MPANKVLTILYIQLRYLQKVLANYSYIQLLPILYRYAVVIFFVPLVSFISHMDPNIEKKHKLLVSPCLSLVIARALKMQSVNSIVPSSPSFLVLCK